MIQAILVAVKTEWLRLMAEFAPDKQRRSCRAITKPIHEFISRHTSGAITQAWTEQCFVTSKVTGRARWNDPSRQWSVNLVL